MNGEPKKKNKQGLTHITIPGEVGFNPELSHTDKLVWWVINTLDTTPRHCFATNAYIAKRAFVKERTVSNSVSKLIKMGYIKRDLFSKGDRILIVEKNLEKFRSILTDYNAF